MPRSLSRWLAPTSWRVSRARIVTSQSVARSGSGPAGEEIGGAPKTNASAEAKEDGTTTEGAAAVSNRLLLR